jgi:hypothetical protein
MSIQYRQQIHKAIVETLTHQGCRCMTKTLYSTYAKLIDGVYCIAMPDT